MDDDKRKRLEAAGWPVGEAEAFLGFTEEEATIVAAARQKATRPDGTVSAWLFAAALASPLGLRRSQLNTVEETTTELDAPDPPFRADLHIVFSLDETGTICVACDQIGVATDGKTIPEACANLAEAMQLALETTGDNS